MKMLSLYYFIKKMLWSPSSTWVSYNMAYLKGDDEYPMRHGVLPLSGWVVGFRLFLFTHDIALNTYLYYNNTVVGIA